MKLIVSILNRLEVPKELVRDVMKDIIAKNIAPREYLNEIVDHVMMLSAPTDDVEQVVWNPVSKYLVEQMGSNDVADDVLMKSFKPDTFIRSSLLQGALDYLES